MSDKASDILSDFCPQIPLAPEKGKRQGPIPLPLYGNKILLKCQYGSRLSALIVGLGASQAAGWGIYSTLTGSALAPLPLLYQPFLHTPAILPGGKARMLIGISGYVFVPKPLYAFI